ncbi:MAG: DUF885 domain-containing protein [Rhodobacteraceae bacterium]|jgi:hypothetical protein|nr:DUF885 domain-containing protein [Paracoccaceae bacterium]
MTDLVDRYLAHRFRWRPVDATFIGAGGHDHRLPPLGPDCVAAERDEAQALLDDAAADTTAHPQDRRLIRAELSLELARMDSRPRQHNPAWYTGEAGFGIIALLLPQSEPTRHDAVVARLSDLPRFLAQGQSLLAGRPVPKGWTDRARREAAALCLFLREDIRLHPAFHPAWADPATQAAQALEVFAAAIADAPDADPACGEAHLARVFAECHLLDLTPAEAVRQAGDAFARCTADLQEMARAIDPDQSWQAQVAALASIHPATEAEVLDHYRHWDAEARAAADRHGLVTPDGVYGLDYRHLPACFARVAGPLYFLFYRSPPGLDPGAGSVYWVMPAPDGNLAAHSTAMVKAIHAVHHGSVGHHTQNARARVAPSRLGRIAATDCAMGLAFPAALTLVEGWACHVEDLLIEAPGFYTPAEILLLKSFERRNAASVLVDVNLHAGRWTQPQAETFYRDEAGFAPARVHGEVVRNSMFPGSRATYWLGVEGIRALRTRWTGSTRAFHDRLLSQGHVPLAMVAQAMADARELNP